MSVKNYSNTVDLEKMGIPKIKGDISTLNSSVNDLAVVVGNDTSGLVKAVDDLEGVVGDSGSGLVRAVDMLSSEIEDMAKLPDVTSVDNGKILGVVNGTWDKTENTYLYNYTLSEQKIGKWIDNKDLYVKTVVVPASDFSDGGDVQIAHGIQNVDVICGFKGFARLTDGTSYENYSTNYFYVGIHSADRTNTHWNIGGDIKPQINELIMTLYYTKIST